MYLQLYGNSYDDQLLNGTERAEIEKTSKILDYIRQQKTPISFVQLHKAFPTYAKRSLKTYLVGQDEIINYRMRYLSVQQLNIKDIELELLKERIQTYLKKYSVAHIEDLYLYLNKYLSNVLSKIFVENSYELYSVLCRLYKEEFAYKRPFIGLNGYELPTKHEWLCNYTIRFHEISLEDVLIYSRERNLQINNIIEFVISINRFMVLKDRDVLIRWEKTGLNDSILKNIENVIYEELKSTEQVKAIRDLECIVKFPAISIPWNEWLIFSSLMRISQMVYLFTTSNKYKNAIPVISLYNNISPNVLEAISDKYADYVDQNTNVVIDDLEDLDSLIENEIELDDIDLDFDEDY